MIKDFYNDTIYGRSGDEPSENDLDLLWATTVSIFAIGGMFGGLLGGWWSEYFGRKRGMLFNTFVGILAGLLMGLSEISNSIEMIIIGRFIVGFNCGTSYFLHLLKRF